MLPTDTRTPVILINSAKTALARSVHRALFSITLATPLAAVMIAQPAVAQARADAAFDIRPARWARRLPSSRQRQG